MADVELVVRIPEEEYNRITKSDNTVFANVVSKEAMMYAIKNGTVLPEGHGRLGDLDELEQRISNFVERDAHITDEYTVARQRFIVDGIRQTTAIIEADTRNKEKEDITPYITGATLLSVEEAKNLNKEILKADKNWWLRSPGDSGICAACVFGEDGCVIAHGLIVVSTLGVRPALEISNLESSGYKIGESVYFGGYSFTIISDTYALCDDMIGECAFCKYPKAKDVNKYETSDIKRYVETWFEKIKEQSREERDFEEERDI